MNYIFFWKVQIVFFMRHSIIFPLFSSIYINLVISFSSQSQRMNFITDNEIRRKYIACQNYSEKNSILDHRKHQI